MPTERVSSLAEYNLQRQRHWDEIALLKPGETFFSREYHRRLRELYRHIISPGQSVLEIGCGRGDLLAAVAPARGVGLDFSASMITQARLRHPGLTFIQGEAHDLGLDEQFDVIILSDLVNDLWDVQTMLEQVRRLCKPDSRLVLNFYSRVYQPALNLAGT